MGGVGLLVGKIRGLFGASKEELQGRSDYAEFSQRMRQEFADNQRYVEEVRTAMNKGMSDEMAHAKAAFQVVAEASGRAWDDGSRLHDQYLNAIKSGNLQLMAQAETTFTKWREEAGMAGESMTESFDTFFQGVTAERAPALTEAMIAMFTKGKEVGADFGQAMMAMFADMGAAADRAINGIIDSLSRIPREITTVHTTIQRTVSKGGGIGYTPPPGGGAPPPPGERIVRVPQPVLLVDDVTDAVLRRTPAIVDLRGA